MFCIKYENLSVGYKDRAVLTELNFTVSSGDYLIIVGENGSGKSTLIKTMAGLLKPVRGEIIFDGISRKEIGYLSQNIAVSEDFIASVNEVVLSGNIPRMYNRFFYNREDKKRVDESLDILGITHLKNKEYNSLSGGEKQRVLLARAICTGGRILILDEPMTGLDFKIREKLYENLLYLSNKSYAIVMVSHRIEDARRYANKILEVPSIKERIKFTEE